MTALIVPYAGCVPPWRHGDAGVTAVYDPDSGRLRQLVHDANRNGRPEAWSHMEGTRVVRIELDRDENGVVERWEYYGPDRELQKIGIASAGDGIVDTWAFRGPDGGPARIERSTRRDGTIDRVEHYHQGLVQRAEQDVDHDGRTDRWETYAAGALTLVAFDTEGRGAATRWFAPGPDGALQETRPPAGAARE